ncbi:MAG: ATP-binding protein [Actinobacteria bacterium]|nr:MAG: ATP-binding protein [Actinomycetota bacterium]
MRCSPRSRRPSRNDARRRNAFASSSPTPRTSCGRRSRRSAATRSSSAAGQTCGPRISPRRCGGSRTRRGTWVSWSTTCCCWRGSTRAARSLAPTSISGAWPRTRWKLPARSSRLGPSTCGWKGERRSLGTRGACARSPPTSWTTRACTHPRERPFMSEFGPTEREFSCGSRTKVRAWRRRSLRDAARSRETGGAGLGLSIVAAIVHAHGGRVRASSADGSGGAAFEVWLPAGGDGDGALGSEPARPGPAAAGVVPTL